VNTDSSNDLAKRRESELDPYGVRIQGHMIQFKSWLGKQGEWLEEVLARSESARAHAIYLQETSNKAHLMSDAEEALAKSWRKRASTGGSNCMARSGRNSKSRLNAMGKSKSCPCR
jgi:hypothetical protein